MYAFMLKDILKKNTFNKSDVSIAPERNEFKVIDVDKLFGKSLLN